MAETRRVEWGQEYVLKEYVFETGLYQRWESLNPFGNKVTIEPLASPSGAWRLSINGEENKEFWGKNAEKRAFCVADGSIRQPLT